MSDQQNGPGWWLASDGKWYPPDSAPPVPLADSWSTTAPLPAPQPGMSAGAKVALLIGGIVGAIALLVGTVVLLGSSDADAPDGGRGGELAPPPSGFEVLEGDGVTIAAPTGWTLLQADDVAMTDDEFARAFPDAPTEMMDQGLDMFSQGAVLVAFDFGASTDFADNVNVIDVPGEAPLDEVAAEAGGQLETFGADIIDTARVPTAQGEAVRIEYAIDVSAPGGTTVPATGVQYYLPLDGRTYIVTVTAGDAAGALGDQMIDTFDVA